MTELAGKNSDRAAMGYNMMDGQTNQILLRWNVTQECVQEWGLVE
ncbi:hypothetical protein [Paenibacillus xylanexedens]|nr:hypothetical protein [Paenibacillus xylanexedens]